MSPAELFAVIGVLAVIVAFVCSLSGDGMYP